MNFLRGPDRSETQILPPCFDDYVAANSPTRFIEVYVEEKLDLKALGFARTQPAETGRPGYHPADLLKLYLYGYLNRIRSSRRLEAETRRNLELMWLLRGIKPDFKTIADFRKNNRAAFKPLFKEFNLLCRRLNLFAAELVAIDGSKFKALNNKRRHYTPEELKELVAVVEKRINDYLEKLDQQDEEAEGVTGEPSQEELKEKLEQLKQRQGNYKELLDAMVQSGTSEVSLTDPDSRKMKGPQAHLIGYNVQLAVDGKHDLIAVQEVTQAANDRNELAAMAQAAKEELKVENLKVVADSGYNEAQQLEACEKAGVEAVVAPMETTQGQTRTEQKVFPKDQFKYDAQADTYLCPGGQTLSFGYMVKKHGKDRREYYNYAACRSCQVRSQCTKSQYRRISRLENEEVLERNAARVAAQPEVMKRRREIVEHVFGTLRNWDHDHFLMKGLEKVRAEFSLSALAYNLRRVLNVVGVEELIKAVQKPA